MVCRVSCAQAGYCRRVGGVVMFAVGAKNFNPLRRKQTSVGGGTH